MTVNRFNTLKIHKHIYQYPLCVLRSYCKRKFDTFSLLFSCQRNVLLHKIIINAEIYLSREFDFRTQDMKKIVLIWKYVHYCKNTFLNFHQNMLLKRQSP